MTSPTNPTDGSERATLAECPIGLFWSDHELCLKTEYGNNEGRIDAYIVSTGEFFWGSQPQTIANQRAQLVTPIDTDAAVQALSSKNELPSEIELAIEAGRIVLEGRGTGLYSEAEEAIRLLIAALNPKDTGR
jgi:hypothetical protein